ncbi:hypothetical protein [Streptomyces griseomycini]|uniref:Uncharacterized protein n=1 Tax=Streptomyces griseomycini TaxID=66895 RepID=A0A7W7PN79_9ACTN|nr:hypothetical protein [Streptomyces griseomycini]MBB4896149.1 hypothetical protein [Streptomyces griseomycini]GGQ22730.1 hypothetical protein GCM10010266_52280 [Streptomyces griseomycini]GGR61272.1 hypothetical protein GCM10015536_76620 [Streptomyces griseomycini]
MARTHGSWLGGRLTARSLLKPRNVAWVVFHPAWIPEPLDPSVEQLKRLRVIVGAIASFGVYTFIEGGFAFDELMENALTASAVLLFITPLTVGVMLFVWRRGGTVRQLRGQLLNCLKLLLLFVGSVVVMVVLLQYSSALGGPAFLLLALVALWLLVFVVTGAIRVSGNFFGTAAVHRSLPALLATVTTWLMAIPDLVTGDLHGLSLTMGVVFILGAPVTVTAIALLETGRLKRRYRIRLGTHPASLPPLPGPVPPVPPTGLPHVPPQGNPYGHPYAPTTGGHPYAPYPQSPYAPGAGGNPYAPQPPYPPQNPRGPYGG